MKRLVFACVATLWAGAGAASELTGWHWTERSFHISAGDLSSTSVGPDDWVAAFGTAVERWNDAALPFSITSDGLTQLESCDVDDPNTAYFSADPCNAGQEWPDGVVGVSVTWSEAHSGEALQTSILFNADETWDVYDGPPMAAVDFTRVAVHEIGHSIGLDHTTTTGAIMEPVGSDVITPQSDDLAGVHIIYNTVDVVVLPDVNTNGRQEIAPIRRRAPNSNGRVQVRETNNGSPVRSFSYFNGYTPVTMVMVDDRNGNGVPELASVQSRNTDGRTLFEVRDPSTSANVANIWFSRNHTARFAAAIADTTGNGQQDYVVVHTRNSDGAVAAQIRDSASGGLARNVYYSSGFYPVDMAVVPDVNGNNAQEIAVALVQIGSARGLVQVRDSLTGSVVANTWLPASFELKNIAVLGDTNSNGAPDIAALAQRVDNPATGAGPIAVRISDASTGAALRSIWFRPTGSSIFGRHALAAVPDFSGNGLDEVSILVQLTSSQRTVLTTRDALTGAEISTIFVSPDFDGERLVVVDSLNGNNASEVGVYGFDRNLLPQMIMYDPSTSTRLNTVFFPFMVAAGN